MSAGVGGEIQNLSGSIIGCHNDLGIVWRVSHGIQHALHTCCVQLFAAGEVPDDQMAAVAARKQTVAAVIKRDSINVVGMAFQRGLQSTAEHVVDEDFAIDPGRSDSLPVRMNVHRIQRAGSVDLFQLTTTQLVPQSNRIVSPGRHDPQRIGTERQAEDRSLVTAERANLPTGDRVPEANGLVSTCGDQRLAVVAEHKVEDASTVSGHVACQHRRRIGPFGQNTGFVGSSDAGVVRQKTRCCSSANRRRLPATDSDHSRRRSGASDQLRQLPALEPLRC